MKRLCQFKVTAIHHLSFENIKMRISRDKKRFEEIKPDDNNQGSSLADKFKDDFEYVGKNVNLLTTYFY